MEIYCKHCGACGEEGCCPPTVCVQKQGGKYCDYYLHQLKVSNEVIEELFGWLLDNEYHEVLTKIGELEDKFENI